MRVATELSVQALVQTCFNLNCCYEIAAIYARLLILRRQEQLRKLVQSLPCDSQLSSFPNNRLLESRISLSGLKFEVGNVSLSIRSRCLRCQDAPGSTHRREIVLSSRCARSCLLIPLVHSIGRPSKVIVAEAAGGLPAPPTFCNHPRLTSLSHGTAPSRHREARKTWSGNSSTRLRCMPGPSPTALMKPCAFSVAAAAKL